MTATWQIIEGDCRETLAALPAGSVQTCVTSPPYFGLRDYGHDGQIGLEPTPDEFVAALVGVFHEVRRVLRDDGTVWLNLGDSYASSPPGIKTAERYKASGLSHPNGLRDGVLARETADKLDTSRLPGIKQKDLLGIPWAVAQALRAPYYGGEIKTERDRVWLAATLDAEGSISGFTHVRADDGSTRTGVHITITNTVERLLNEADRIWPASRVEHENHGEGHYGSRPSWRWVAHGAERKALLMRELYPYMIAKREQVRLAYAFFLLNIDAKRLGHSPQRDTTREKRAWIVNALSRLNHGEGVDVPSWIGEPPTVEERGWYLRSDIIWNKINPMPESVTDRPTKAHEYLFLLSKRPTYHYDADAIREPGVEPERQRADGIGGANGHTVRHSEGAIVGASASRNKRSVWTVATQPFPGAHFATFPPKLIEPCILAGCPERACGECGAPWERIVAREVVPGARDAGRVVAQESKGALTAHSGHRGSVVTETVGFAPSCGHDAPHVPGVVLDPFAGAGTTGLVALRHGRSFIGCELSSDYVRLARDRIIADSPLLNTHAERATTAKIAHT